MKLVLIIAGASDGERLIEALVGRGLPATKLASQGGFLRRGSVTIMSGVADEQVESVLELVRQECHTRTEKLPTHAAPLFSPELELPSVQSLEVRVGGATVFVLDVQRFERF